MLINLGNFPVDFGGPSVNLPAQAVNGGTRILFTLGTNPLSTVVQYGYFVVSGILSEGAVAAQTKEVYEWYPDLFNRYFTFDIPDLGQPSYDFNLRVKPIQQFRQPAAPQVVDLIARYWNLPV